MQNREEKEVEQLSEEAKSLYVRKLGKISSMLLKKGNKMNKPVLYGSINLVHGRVVEHETTLLLEKMIGPNLTALYAGALCQLEEKKK